MRRCGGSASPTGSVAASGHVDRAAVGLVSREGRFGPFSTMLAHVTRHDQPVLLRVRVGVGVGVGDRVRIRVRVRVRGTSE